MSFKDISYLELWMSFCSAEQSQMCNFGRGNYFEFGQVVQEVMSSKDISYLELWCPLYSAKWDSLCSFGSSHHEE